MSDYIYMLESHLSPEQNRVVAEAQKAAERAGVNLFLTGGAMRDMLGGFQIRDLDFTVEGNGLKLAKAVAEESGARLLASDEQRNSAELLFPTGVTAQIAMSRQEKYARTGAKPQVSPATIQEDLRGRDFTCNSIALSLNRASRGLLLDPMNGLADIGRRELRATTAYGFYDDPTRLLRLERFRVRLGFTVEERTRMQVANAREAEVERLIPPRAMAEELKRIAMEDSPAEILKGLEEAGLLVLFSPVLTGPKLNLPGFAKFEKLARMLPDDPQSRAARFAPFYYVLIEKLTPRERQALPKALDMPKDDLNLWLKLEPRAKKLETALRASRIRKPSHVYHLVAAAGPDEVLLLLYRATPKPVQDRLRAYFQKYLPAVQEITPEEWATVEGKPGTSRYAKARQDFVSHYLDRRPKRIPPEPPSTPAAEQAAGGPGLRQPNERGREARLESGETFGTAATTSQPKHL